ncbi:MAG: radical SAM protein [Deltaproteobacteria bacterium]|nr:radical SAM protein [Deltaproteobacteria bacterium]
MPAERPPFLEFTGLAVLVTARCPFACAHCYTRSGPKREERLDLAWALPGLEAILPHVRAVSLTGGEPFLEPELVVALARQVGGRVPVSVVSAGDFAREPGEAARTLAAFREAGVVLVNLSHDAHHAPFGGLELVISAARLCQAAGLPVIVQLTGRPGEPAVAEATRRLRAAGVDLFRAELSPFGRAERLPPELFGGSEAATEGGCSNLRFLSLDYRGVLRACCGPTLDCGPESAYVLADLAAGDDPGAALQAARHDRVLAGVAALGPRALAACLGRETSSEVPVCKTCVELLSDPEATRRLDALLSSREQERRLVASQMIFRETFERDFDEAFASVGEDGVGRG